MKGVWLKHGHFRKSMKARDEGCYTNVHEWDEKTNGTNANGVANEWGRTKTATLTTCIY